MSTHDHDATRDGDALPPGLRLQLRASRRDDPPSRDLWPGIAARLDAPAHAGAGAPRHGRPRIARWLALAASVCAAVAIGWQAWPTAPGDGLPASTGTVVAGAGDGAARGSAPPPPLLREADAMIREYDAAVLEIRHAGASGYPQDAVEALERSAREIRQALARDPGSRFLLDRLQRVHAHRLALVQRFA
jgi:hypothetical protein